MRAGIFILHCPLPLPLTAPHSYHYRCVPLRYAGGGHSGGAERCGSREREAKIIVAEKQQGRITYIKIELIVEIKQHLPKLNNLEQTQLL